MVANIQIYYDFEKDWLKQKSLIKNFKTEGVIKNNTTFVFHDKLTELNTNSRFYRFYEYTGLFKQAFGETTRLGQDASIRKNLQIFKKYKSYVYFNIQDYKVNPNEYDIIIKEGIYPLTLMNYLELKFNSNFNIEEYKKDLKNIVELEIRQ